MDELPERIARFDPEIEHIFPNAKRVFTLESGAKELASYFDTVEINRYNNELYVTEIDALVEYVVSTIGIEIDDKRPTEFAAFTAAEMKAQGGGIRISKDSGILIAHKP